MMRITSKTAVSNEMGRPTNYETQYNSHFLLRIMQMVSYMCLFPKRVSS